MIVNIFLNRECSNYLLSYVHKIVSMLRVAYISWEVFFFEVTKSFNEDGIAVSDFRFHTSLAVST